MSIRDLVAPSLTVKVGDGGFEVRGLSIADVANLMDGYTQELAALFDGDVTIADLVKTSPGFVAKLIASAAGEPDAVDAVERLPVGVQIRALEAIWELTEVSTDQLGNMLGQALVALEGLNASTGSAEGDLTLETGSED